MLQLIFLDCFIDVILILGLLLKFQQPFNNFQHRI
jgi:hypothetical protein